MAYSNKHLTSYMYVGTVYTRCSSPLLPDYPWVLGKKSFLNQKPKLPWQFWNTHTYLIHVLPYSGQLSRKKTFINWQKRFSRRKLSQIAHWCSCQKTPCPSILQKKTLRFCSYLWKFSLQSWGAWHLLAVTPVSNPRKFSLQKPYCWSFLTVSRYMVDHFLTHMHTHILTLTHSHI